MGDIRRIVGQNVRKARHAAGMSQEDLAHRARIDRTYVSGVERGLRNPTITVLARVASALGVEPSALLEVKAAHLVLDEPAERAGSSRAG